MFFFWWYKTRIFQLQEYIHIHIHNHIHKHTHTHTYIYTHTRARARARACRGCFVCLFVFHWLVRELGHVRQFHYPVYDFLRKQKHRHTHTQTHTHTHAHTPTQTNKRVYLDSYSLLINPIWTLIIFALFKTTKFFGMYAHLFLYLDLSSITQYSRIFHCS